jgi:pyridoxine/pyridoxamine 5'-phosphate oxidase
MSNWFETLEGIRTKVWERLWIGVEDKAHVAFGTVGADGQPEVRTVVMRDVNPKTHTIEIYTDLQSAKISSLTLNPIAAIHLWDTDLGLQIRLQVDVTILSGADVRQRWENVPDHSRVNYGSLPSTGQEIPTRTAFSKTVNPDVFAVLLCNATAIDAVYLGDTHCRASFSQVGDWQGKWLAP